MAATRAADATGKATDTGKAEESQLVLTLGAERSSTSVDGTPSDRPRWEPLLGISYNDGRFFAGTQRGIAGVGYEVFKTESVSVFGAVGYSGGRKDGNDKDSPRFKGMGKIEASALLAAGVEWSPFGDLLQLSWLTLASTKREQGYGSAFGATVGFPIWGPLNGSVSISTLYADRKSAQTYYGVTAAQSIRSGNPVYEAKAGWVQRELSLDLTYDINKQWSATAGVGRLTRTGPAAKSPLYTKRNEPTATLAISYSF